MKKLLIVVLTVLTVAAMLAGCTQANIEQPNATPPTENTDKPAAKIADQAVDAQGKLIGRIDNNSVEIELNPEDTLAFRVSDVLDQLEGIKDGEMVKFSYSPNDQGQLIITKIEKLQ